MALTAIHLRPNLMVEKHPPFPSELKRKSYVCKCVCKRYIFFFCKIAVGVKVLHPTAAPFQGTKLVNKPIFYHQVEASRSGIHFTYYYFVTH